MRINVSIVVGMAIKATRCLEASPSDTVRMVRHQVKANAEGWQSLKFNGRHLSDDSTLRECRIQDGSKLELTEIKRHNLHLSEY